MKNSLLNLRAWELWIFDERRELAVDEELNSSAKIEIGLRGGIWTPRERLRPLDIDQCDFASPHRFFASLSGREQRERERRQKIGNAFLKTAAALSA